MPSLAATSTISFPHRVAQEQVKEYAAALFRPSYPQIDRMMSAYDNTGIRTRNFCQPLTYYGRERSFKEQNDDYCRLTLDAAAEAAANCLQQAGISKEQLTDIIFVSSTGLATPSMDAHIINVMRLPQNIRRTPIFGLGCAGGVAGYARACAAALADPEAIVLLITAELCSLTFMRNDFSKSNFIGSGLFADGVAACIFTGDKVTQHNKTNQYIAAQSRIYPDSLDVMGWDFSSDGFKVLFSQDIPSLVSRYIRDDVDHFLAQQGISLEQIRHFIFHPGGTKVLSAYEEALGIDAVQLANTRMVMQENGNMSAPTVLYVLDRLLQQTPEDGYGIMLAMGPGFSSEMVLLEFNNSTNGI